MFYTLPKDRLLRNTEQSFRVPMEEHTLRNYEKSAEKIIWT
jgi:hypothetical protein